MQLQTADRHDVTHDERDIPAPLATIEATPAELSLERLTLGQRVRRLLGRIWIGLYVPAILQGMAKTFEYMFRPKFTQQYPEVKPNLRKGYRGEHRLKVDEHGHPKCVACFMCQTACPAECITIVAAPAPADWVGRDKRPIRFDIDLLKCIYCGMCEEACPCDAIELTTTFTQVATKREHKLHDIDVLLGRKPPPGSVSP